MILFLNIKCMFSIKTDLCEMNYCPDGIKVDFDGESYSGHYDIQPIYVNDRPYFKMGAYGLWWSNGFWWIGGDSYKGENGGEAYYEADDYCPHQLKEKKNWFQMMPQGWIGLGTNNIVCKYITITSLHNVHLHSKDFTLTLQQVLA